MRKINYLLISDKPTDRRPLASGFHYTVNSQGRVLNAIDIHKPGSFMPKPATGQEDLNRCSIGIKYNGKLSDRQLRPPLIALLLNLRSHFPEAKILGLSEYDRYHLKVRDDMNDLRRELSDYQ